MAMPDDTVMTRRRFTAGGLAAAAAGAVSLQLTACRRAEDPIGSRLPAKPVLAGAVSRYLRPGVYDDLKGDNIWLYSDGRHLFALAAVCPHQHCTVRHDGMAGQFTCPCHYSRFTLEGLVKQGSKAEVSLERCRIRRVSEGGEDRVEVDPTQRYREDKNQWSSPHSLLVLQV
jgi:Rieske Fe-S protein